MRVQSDNLPSGRRVLIAGASGLVGQHLLQALLADASVTEVLTLGRRPQPWQHVKLQPLIVDFAHLPTLPPVDEAYLVLGTTLKQAGSEAAFHAVDYTANLAVAKAALAAGAQRIALVSAAGADARSHFFYNRTKGELELALRQLNPAGLLVARPALLLGDRAALGQPHRPLEHWSQRLMGILGPLLPVGWRPIAAETIARALTDLLPTQQGVRVLSSAELQRHRRLNALEQTDVRS